jgi:hypothetical protein
MLNSTKLPETIALLIGLIIAVGLTVLFIGVLYEILRKPKSKHVDNSCKSLTIKQIVIYLAIISALIYTDARIVLAIIDLLSQYKL